MIRRLTVAIVSVKTGRNNNNNNMLLSIELLKINLYFNKIIVVMDSTTNHSTFLCNA